jgi:5-methylcytosine-specific restriction endonuclease McrA
MAEHRRPEIPFSEAPRGTCRWCGDPILYATGPRRGEPNRRRRWHPQCVEAYNASDPRELRRLVRRRDRGHCAVCGLDTYALRRRTHGRKPWAKLRERGFVRRRSLWELDHVVPLIDGGSHEPANLQTLCVPCHREKSGLENRARARQRRAGRRPSAEQRARKPRRGRDSGELDRELDALLERVEVANARVAAALEEGVAPPVRPSGGAAPAVPTTAPTGGSPRSRRRSQAGLPPDREAPGTGDRSRRSRRRRGR